MITVATVGGLMAMFAWGVGDYLAGKSAGGADAYLTNFIIQAVSVVLLVPVVLYFGFMPEYGVLPLLVLIAALFTVAYIAFVKALAIGPFGVAAPLANSYALVTLLLGALFFGSELTLQQWVTCGVIVLGVALLAVDRTTFVARYFHSSTLVPAIIALLSWGLAFALVEVAARELRWVELLFTISVLVTVFSYGACWFRSTGLPRWSEVSYSSQSWAWWSGGLLFVGILGFYVAVDVTEAVAVPAVIASASPLITACCAAYWDDERITLLKRVGALLVVGGIMALNFI